MVAHVALISDIHGNSPALRAVLDDIRRTGCSTIFVLGDIVNGVDPHGCVELLSTRSDVSCLKGNAEFYLLTPDLEAFPIQEQPRYAEVIRLVQWWRSHLSAAHLEWLQRLPNLILWRGACLVHDSPLDRVFADQRRIEGIDEKYQELCYHARGLTPDMAEDELEQLLLWMETQSVSQVFCGHTHTPFCRKVGRRLICNTGSVGMPLDGDPRPSWAMLKHEAGGDRAVTIRRVSYDIDHILHMVDTTSNYPAFEHPVRRDAYKQMLTTGIHWSAYLS